MLWKPSRSLGPGLAAAACLAARCLGAPCDIYAVGGTPCVAAHGTTRALYSAYEGPLYQVVRGSDGATADIAPLSPGGVANAAMQDAFCANTTCLISVIYDQSGSGNHLRRAPGGAFRGPEADGSDNLASAIGAPVTLGGQRAYGVFVSPGTGYRNNAARGIAVADQPEGIYAVLDGSHYNDGCCFDYGNAEVGGQDTGNGHMEAIYYGDNTFWGSGAGSGPWLMADLENGLFSGRSPKNNPADPSISYRFFTAAVKGKPNQWALRGADAQRPGSLSTYYSGVRPAVAGYNPMRKEGAIILGIGGDNSIGAQGTFYEGAMTAGYPSDATEDAVQANIAAAGYATASPNTGPRLAVGSVISLRATSSSRYIASSGSVVGTRDVSSSSTAAVKKQASWTVRTGLGNGDCYSFESVDAPGSFLRHHNFVLVLDANDHSKQYAEDATFCSLAGLNGQGISIRSWSYPTRFLRHFNNNIHVASNGGVHLFDATASYIDDVSWIIGAGFA